MDIGGHQSRETVEVHRYDGNVVIVVTNQRVTGLGEITGRWSGVDLGLNEQFRKIFDVSGNVGSVITTERVPGFSAETGGWDSTDLENR